MEFPRRTHHICLVSEQTLPNYLGAIVPEAFPKKVHLVVTSRMKERADILQKALEARGYGVEQYALAEPLPDAVMAVLDAIYEKTEDGFMVTYTNGAETVELIGAVVGETFFIKNVNAAQTYIDQNTCLYLGYALGWQ